MKFMACVEELELYNRRVSQLFPTSFWRDIQKSKRKNVIPSRVDQLSILIHMLMTSLRIFCAVNSLPVVSALNSQFRFFPLRHFYYRLFYLRYFFSAILPISICSFDILISLFLLSIFFFRPKLRESERQISMPTSSNYKRKPNCLLYHKV